METGQSIDYGTVGTSPFCVTIGGMTTFHFPAQRTSARLWAGTSTVAGTAIISSARSLKELQDDVRTQIAAKTGDATEDVQVIVDVQLEPQLMLLAEDVKAKGAAARNATAAYRESERRAAIALRDLELSQRDVAFIMDTRPGRISDIENGAGEYEGTPQLRVV